MKIGRLRQRVIIQEEVFTKDSITGETTSEWQDVCTVWAAVEPLKGREFFQALETHAEHTIRIRLRYRAGLSSAMRVQYSSRTLYIQAIIDPEERHKELQLMCVENQPPGPGE